MIQRFFVFLFACFSLITVPGCLDMIHWFNPYDTVRQTNDHIDDAKDEAHAAQDALVNSDPAVAVRRGFYVDTRPVSLQKEPTWLKQHISLNAQNIPFNLLVSRILRNTHATVSYQPEIQTDVLVSLRYTGTIKGALNELASKTNYAYEVKGDEVFWQSLITKTFSVSFMPGSSTYLVGQTSGSGTNSSSSAGDVVTVKGNFGNEQYSNLQAQLSIWKDIEKTLNQLKSKDGKIFVSESTTSVTVQDHPSNVRAMGEFIAQLNDSMSKQVSIQVRVLQVALDKSFNYGIDWNLVQNWLGTQFDLTGNLGTEANVSGAISQSGGNGILSFQIGKSDSFAILQALSQQGELTVVTQPVVTTMNNQVAEIRITRDTGYLQSITTTAIANSGSQTALTPGTVTDGFSLYLLPKIEGNKIYLQLSTTLSTLTSITTVSNQPSNASQASQEAAAASGTFQAIQVPNLTENHFNQRTIVYNGNTLIITGYQQLRDQTNTISPFGLTILGGKGAETQRIQTIVCITPTIVEGRS